MTELTERYKIEDAAMACSDTMSTHSIAISLKRIADLLQGVVSYTYDVPAITTRECK